MKRESQIALIERLFASIDTNGLPAGIDESAVDVTRYLSPERLSAEERVLFRRQPVVLCHSSEIPSPGDYLTTEFANAPILVVRGASGEVSAFLNVCRHRGARLVAEPCGHASKAFVCRYHSWTYDLGGALTHVPMREAFPSLDDAPVGLRGIKVQERYGLVWGIVDGDAPIAMEERLRGPIDDDLTAFELDRHVVFRMERRRRASNWKLVIEAFLEGYHAKYLHRATLARFFLERGTLIDVFGDNVRSVGPRRAVREMQSTPRDSWDIRAAATVFYFLFPNTILVVHPDYHSLLTLFPDGTDGCWFVHRMLVPKERAGEEERVHWEKTFQLIDQTVFEREDLAISESIQSSLRSGANESFRIGAVEYPIRVFHDAMDRVVREGE